MCACFTQSTDLCILYTPYIDYTLAMAICGRLLNQLTLNKMNTSSLQCYSCKHTNQLVNQQRKEQANCPHPTSSKVADHPGLQRTGLIKGMYIHTCRHCTICRLRYYTLTRMHESMDCAAQSVDCACAVYRIAAHSIEYGTHFGDPQRIP